MMAQEFSPQRVLGSEERSGHYGRASMYALRGKGQASTVCTLKTPYKALQNVKHEYFTTVGSAAW